MRFLFDRFTILRMVLIEVYEDKDENDSYIAAMEQPSYCLQISTGKRNYKRVSSLTKAF